MEQNGITSAQADYIPRSGIDTGWPDDGQITVTNASCSSYEPKNTNNLKRALQHTLVYFVNKTRVDKSLSLPQLRRLFQVGDQ